MTSADGIIRARCRVQRISISIRAGLSPIPRCGSARSSSSRACSFTDRNLWETALKLKSQVENPGAMHRQYAEALGIALMHELIRINGGAALHEPVSRGGLASWQQKRVAAYIEEHVADDIPLATLAELARLSPYHFSRSFKSSFGMPPHRYHAHRRIERAKQLLANRELSITAIALDVGFSETSTFSAAFHRLTGQIPSRYRRNLD